MLRAVRWQEKMGRWDMLAAFVRRCVRPAAVCALMFLMMHNEIIPGSAPFAAALFAAGLISGENPAAMVLGCLLGMLRLPVRDISMIPAVGCAGVLAAEIAFSLSRRLRTIPRETRASLTAGFGLLLPALAFAGGDALESIRALGCAALASASAPFMLPAMDLRMDRRRLMTQEKIGAALLLGACLGGLHSLWPPLARSAALICVLALHDAGAAGGVVWGIALLRDGFDLTSLMAVCGLLSGLKIYTRRWQRSLSVLLGWSLARLLGMEIWIAEALCASLVYLLLPENFAEGMAAMAAKPEPDWSPERISRDAAEQSCRKLRALGDAFGEMAEGCAAPIDVPDEQALILEMRSRLCAGCCDYGECWSGGEDSAARFLCRLISEGVSMADAPAGMRVLYSDGEIPPDILRFCRRGRMIPDRLGLLLRDFAEKRRAEIKRCATGQILSAQLSQAREILYDLAEKQSRPIYGRKTEALQAALDGALLGDVRISAYGGGNAEIHLHRDGGWSRSQAMAAREALRRSWGGDFSAELDDRALIFFQKPRFNAQTGAACQSGVAGESCGDSHMIHILSGNRLALMLSDGMGSGDAAANESGESLRLLKCFLDAGISRALALETVNQQMLMRTGDDIFATMDLCIIDLNTGVAEFSKLAACRTLILRGGEVFRVEGGRLPLGVMENVRGDVRRIRLKEGDMVVMGTDGVMELGDGMVIDRIARLSAALEPQQLAEKLVREAALRRSRGHSDDMTCICMRVQGKASRKMA